MFDWFTSKSGAGSAGLAKMRTEFGQMLDAGRHMFDTAANALLGGTDVEVIRKDLFKTDKRINRAERRIRSEIVVHASVHAATEFPACLVLMSIVKDAERMGDYGKNLFDLAEIAPRVPEGEQPAVRVWLGWAVLHQGRAGEAADCFEEALEQRPDLVDAVLGSFRAAIIRGELDKARGHAARIDELAGHTAWGQARRVEALLRAGENERADALARETPALQRTAQERRILHAELALAYIGAGRFAYSETGSGRFACCGIGRGTGGSRSIVCGVAARAGSS